MKKKKKEKENNSTMIEILKKLLSVIEITSQEQ